MATCEYILYGAYSQFSFLYHLSPDIYLLCMCYKVPSVFAPLRGGGGGGAGVNYIATADGLHVFTCLLRVRYHPSPWGGGGGGGGRGLNVLQLQTDYITASLPCMEHSVM